jgi:hypothetical protein
MGAPSTTTATDTKSTKDTATASMKGGVRILGIGGEAGGPAALESGRQTASSTAVERRGMVQVIREIGGSDLVVLLDDFHYMPREVQAEVAKHLKEGVRHGIKICTAAVPHLDECGPEPVVPAASHP